MAFYYKIKDSEIPLPGIQAHEMTAASSLNGPSTKFDFSKHVLIELLDDFTPEAKLWEALNLIDKTYVVQKRLMIDSHRIHCRRAVVVCINAVEAKTLAQRLSQAIIIKRCVCAVVVQELLSDLSLFEKQILNFGDVRPQQQLLYVTDLNRCREPSSLTAYLKERFSIFGTILSVFIAEDKDGYAYPEGVIKFAYLSEAYAAELAYDQLVVGMERLSVTTHHNILLTQCDLRVRLREILQNSASLSESSLSDSGKSALLNKQPSGKSGALIINDERFNIKNASSDKVENSHHTKHMTFKNTEACSVLKKGNLTYVSSNFNKSNRRANKTSVLSLSTRDKTTPFKELISCSKNITSHSPVTLQETIETLLTEEISQINNCENEIPNDIFMQRNPLELSVISNHSKDQILLDDKPTRFVTVNGCNTKIKTMLSNRKITRSFSSVKNTNLESTLENICTSNNLHDSDRKTTKVSSASNDSYSMKREKKKLLSDKLSLKSQRLDFPSQAYDSSFFFKSDIELASPVVRLRRLSSMEIKKWVNRIYTSSAGRGSINEESDYSSDPLVQEVSLDFDGTDSPLRIWLKYELHLSSNNRVSGGCLENSKKVVYATTKQDILVSVGCSHMTCGSCYPGSTNLLFGFR